MSIVRLQGCLELEIVDPADNLIIEVIIQPILYKNQPAYEVDFWKGDTFMASQITKFKATVIMMLEGDMFRIVEPKRYRGANPFWMSLELTIANHIMVNV